MNRVRVKLLSEEFRAASVTGLSATLSGANLAMTNTYPCIRGVFMGLARHGCSGDYRRAPGLSTAPLALAPPPDWLRNHILRCPFNPGLNVIDQLIGKSLHCLG